MSDARVIGNFRDDPDKDVKRYMHGFKLQVETGDQVSLDVLARLKSVDGSTSLRRSHRDDTGGSDAIAIKSMNGLARQISKKELPSRTGLRSLPGFPVIRNPIGDTTSFSQQNYAAMPYLIKGTSRERGQFNGVYVCTHSRCNSTVRPPYRWRPEKYVGHVRVLRAYQFVADSPGMATRERIDSLEDPIRLVRCRTILNCRVILRRNLLPVYAIGQIRPSPVRHQRRLPGKEHATRYQTVVMSSAARSGLHDGLEHHSNAGERT